MVKMNTEVNIMKLAQLREGVSQLLAIITNQPGLRAPAIAEMMQTSPKNVDHWLKQLKGSQRIEFHGAPKPAATS